MTTNIYDSKALYDIKFSFEDYVINAMGIDIYGENKKNTLGGVCLQFLKNKCTRGTNCPYKHIRTEKAVVCKHWLRGLCKKEDQCEFLHEYNLKKMPECWFYTKYGECASGEDCIYLHIDPSAKIPECQWYNRGFCKHGPHCKNKHVRKIACPLYLAGFCPKGPECTNGHAKNELPPLRANEQLQPDFKQRIPHPSQALPSANRNNYENRHQNQQRNQNSNQNGFHPYQNNKNQNNNHNGYKRPLEEVTCYKCNQKGHYANHCPLPKNIHN